MRFSKVKCLPWGLRVKGRETVHTSRNMEVRTARGLRENPKGPDVGASTRGYGEAETRLEAQSMNSSNGLCPTGTGKLPNGFK